LLETKRTGEKTSQKNKVGITQRGVIRFFKSQPGEKKLGSKRNFLFSTYTKPFYFSARVKLTPKKQGRGPDE